MTDEEKKFYILKLNNIIRKNNVFSIAEVMDDDNRHGTDIDYNYFQYTYYSLGFHKIIKAALPYLEESDIKLIYFISFWKSDPDFFIHIGWKNEKFRTGEITDLVECKTCKFKRPLSMKRCPLCGEKY